MDQMRGHVESYYHVLSLKPVRTCERDTAPGARVTVDRDDPKLATQSQQAGLTIALY